MAARRVQVQNYSDWMAGHSYSARIHGHPGSSYCSAGYLARYDTRTRVCTAEY